MRTASHHEGGFAGGASRAVAFVVIGSALAAAPAGAVGSGGPGGIGGHGPVPAPAAARVLDDVTLDAADAGWVLDLSDVGALDAATLDARGDALLAEPGPETIVAHDVLAGLLAWEAGHGIGDGAHASPVLAASAPFGAEPAIGAASVAPSGTDGAHGRRDAFDLGFEGPPPTIEPVTIDAPGLAFERRTLYQATTGRLFVDFRLRHRDPVHGQDALDREARTADAIARMRTLSTVVIVPTHAAASPSP